MRILVEILKSSTIEIMELTLKASEKLVELLEREDRDDLSLRVSVSPGGCSGLRYSLYFDTVEQPDDTVIDSLGKKVVIDKMSAPYLLNAVLDYYDELNRQGFSIDNPDAPGSCACGDSFS